MNGYLSRETRPAWYELSLPDNHTIRISVHRAAYDELVKTDWANAPVVPHFKKLFKFTSFVPPSEKSWGFQEALQQSPATRPEWVAWDCTLPRLKVIGGFNESPDDYPIALRSSLYLLMTVLWLFKGGTAWKDPQLMVIEGISLPVDPERPFSNGSLSVTLGPSVIAWISKWISRHGDHTHISQVVEAMKAASEYMWGHSSGRGRFGALCRKPKWLNLDVPGDACGLDPGDYHAESLHEGYTLHPHNVDSSLQQLTFLAGLARLHELVRADQAAK